MQGNGHGRGGCGAGMDPEKRQRHRYDQSVFHRLLERHHAIERQLEHIDGGIRAVTTSADPEVVALLQDHVPAMHRRLLENFPLRRWDPLYVEIFENRDRIHMAIELLENGVRVVETSDDPYVAQLIQAHGAAVTGFAAEGHQAAQRPSPLPQNA